MDKTMPMNAFDDDLPYLIALNMINGIGNYLGKVLLSRFGSAKKVFQTSRSELRKVPGIGTLTANNIAGFKLFDDVLKELDLMKLHGIHAISLFDDSYPYRLKEIEDNPIVLFRKGSANLNPQRIIAIVGSRHSTTYGKQFTEDLIQALSKHHVDVVSGLAAGTDTNVHRACLKYGVITHGVLGHGFHTMYPGANRNLADELMKSGCLLTEYRFQVPGNKENFPKRNRIVAGMVDAVVVIESGRNGGSMITADLANQYNRDVFALPGKLTDINSAGCNHLIHIHQAGIIESVGSLIASLGYDQPANPSKQRSLDLISNLNNEEKLVASVLKNGPKGIDELMYASKLPMSSLALILLNLEFKGLIKNHPGKIYSISTNESFDRQFSISLD